MLSNSFTFIHQLRRSALKIGTLFELCRVSDLTRSDLWTEVPFCPLLSRAWVSWAACQNYLIFKHCKMCLWESLEKRKTQEWFVNRRWQFDPIWVWKLQLLRSCVRLQGDVHHSSCEILVLFKYTHDEQKKAQTPGFYLFLKIEHNIHCSVYWNLILRGSCSCTWQGNDYNVRRAGSRSCNFLQRKRHVSAFSPNFITWNMRSSWLQAVKENRDNFLNSIINKQFLLRE